MTYIPTFAPSDLDADGVRSWVQDEFIRLAQVLADPGGVSGSVASLRQFGARGDYVTDDTGAFNAAFAWLNARSASEFGKTLIVPAGHYSKTGTHTATQWNTSILGEAVPIIYQKDDLDSIILSSVTPTTSMNDCILKDFLIRRDCGTAANTGVDLKLINQAGLVLNNVGMWGAVNGIEVAGGSGIYLNNVSISENDVITVRRANSALFRVHSIISGTTLQRNTNILQLNNFNIEGKGINALQSYVDYGIQVRGVDNFVVSNGHMGGTYLVDMHFVPSDAAANTDWITSVQVDKVFLDAGSSGAGVVVETGGNAQTIAGLSFNQVICEGHGTHGMQFDYPTKDTMITGCTIRDNAGFGLIVGGGAPTTGFTAVGNRINGNGTNTGGTAVGNASTLLANNNFV